MKKIYTQPKAQGIALHAETPLLSNSLTVSDETTINGEDVRSAERSWRFSDWNNEDND